MDQLVTASIDSEMMRRCIELSRTARAHGEFPFACVICDEGGDVVAESLNRVRRDRDVTKHAEILAIGEAQRKLGATDLGGCTLYSNAEPCPMCSFPIRETGIRKVVYALRSPLMGGYSKFAVLRSEDINRAMPEAFAEPPQVLGGVLAEEAEEAWRQWSPIAWRVIKRRGIFEGDPTVSYSRATRPARAGFNWRRLINLIWA
ncbi:MAG: nucleoside deaminase [Pseudolabrys sp.]|nr:nucleoside deaminase [Pseudolabrys sp.]